MDDYDRAFAAHRLDVPAAFDFARDVVDAWARDPEKLAVVWCDAASNERTLTFAGAQEEETPSSRNGAGIGGWVKSSPAARALDSRGAVALGCEGLRRRAPLEAGARGVQA